MLAILFCLVGLATLPASNAYAAPEVEPNNDTTSATGPFTGDQTLTGSISPGADVDFFRIVVTTASRYSFSTPDDDGGHGCADLNEDPFLRLYDSAGRQIGQDDDGGAGFCSLLEASLETGTYFVSVASCCPGSSEIPDYILAIDPANPCTNTRGAGNDVIRGTPGRDVICAGAGNDIVYGRGGNDTIRGGLGNDILHGGDGEDRLFGDPGNDTLYGNESADSLDTQDGRRGNDAARGGAGADSCATDARDFRSSC